MASRFEGTFRDRVIPAAKRAFGVTVRFSQDGRTSDEFTARRSARTSRVIGANFGGATGVEVTLRDYILPAASLVIGGQQVEPRQGSRVVEGDDVFEINPPDDGTSAIELQPGGYEWVVHTKLVAS